MSIDAPNYTQFPNALIALMPEMREAELKVTLAIARKTFGWHKDEDELSLSQLMKLTGLSKQGVINGIENGIKRGTISRRTFGDSFKYSLVVNEIDTVVNAVDRPSQRSRPEVVNEVDTQKKDKETIQNKSLSKGEPPKSERQEALETMQAAFEKCGGYLNPTMIQRFYAAYDANSDNRPARLEHAVLKLQTDRNFFRAVDAYMQWKPPELKPQYPQKREQFTRPPVRSTLPIRTD